MEAFFKYLGKWNQSWCSAFLFVSIPFCTPLPFYPYGQRSVFLYGEYLLFDEEQPDEKKGFELELVVVADTEIEYDACTLCVESGF